MASRTRTLILTSTLTIAAAGPALAQGTFTEIYKFTGGADGGAPDASVTLDSAGNIYGEARQGGIACGGLPYGCGTVYKIDPSGNETTLVTFDATNGAEALGQPLVVGNTLYGTTYSGGQPNNYQCGVIFSVGTDGSNFQVLHFFNQKDGCYPLGPLLLAPGGKAIYGIASVGGRGRHQGDGLVFQYNIGGSYAVLHAFHGPDGATPNTLLLDANGTLYGSTLAGGASNAGVAYALDPATGTYTILHDFTGKTDESQPALGSIGQNGVIYGAALGEFASAPYQYGTLFSLTPGQDGYIYSQLYTFDKSRSQTAVSFPEGGPNTLPNGNLAGSVYTGLYFYNTLFPNSGAFFNIQTVDPEFKPGDAGSIVASGSVFGTGQQGGGITSQYFPYGAGVVYRWTPGGS